MLLVIINISTMVCQAVDTVSVNSDENDILPNFLGKPIQAAIKGPSNKCASTYEYRNNNR